MEKCCFCQRSCKGGYYLTKNNMIYCYDCYVRRKEKAIDNMNRIKQERKVHGDAWLLSRNKVVQLQNQIKNEGYWVSNDGKKGSWRTDNYAPDRIKQIVNEMNNIEIDGDNHYKIGMQLRDDKNDSDILSAIYHETIE